MKIKICGLTNYVDAKLALELGADFLGFVLYPKSPRAVSVQDAAAMITALRRAHPNSRTKMVGVVVDETDPVATREAANLDLLQFHGDESVDTVRTLSRSQAMKAFRVKEQADLAKISTYVPHVSSVLIDAYSENGAHGGTGEIANWNLATEATRLAPTFLAGGLHAGNVAEAIRAVQPFGIDASSRLEQSPGKKDEHKLREFFVAVRAATAGSHSHKGPL